MGIKRIQTEQIKQHSIKAAVETKWRQPTEQNKTSHCDTKSLCRVTETRGSARETGEHTVQSLELRPFIRRANRIVVMTRGWLNVRNLPSAPDFSGTTNAAHFIFEQAAWISEGQRGRRVCLILWCTASGSYCSSNICLLSSIVRVI